MKSNFRTLFLVVLPLFLFAPALAQTHRASVRGTIYDPNNAAIAGATITLTNWNTGEQRTTTTDSDGSYAISSVPPGEYRLAVEKTNFKVTLRTFKLFVNEQRREDVTIQVGGPDVSVSSLEAQPDPLKKETASLGSVIENRQVTTLPLDGRNFYELSLLVPGAVPPAQGSAGSVRGDFAFSVNGAREDANNFLLDGVYNIDPKLNTFGVRPSVDAIREFEMLTSTYDASFGRNPGAQVNVVLNSGS
ncbi:MAG TPA: carboxypeptidase-like regulatory domain-containing protein, partial [Pyrinomonadaceae bacterium]|nr:carboxypeptidase-like regulatory domain-containing protein [Pyrinomonadaceae bacterium]